LSEQETLRPGGEAGRHCANDGSDQQAQGNRPDTETIHRRADRNLRRGKREMIDRSQAGERLRRRCEIGGHHVEADRRDGSQQGRQHMTAGQRQKRKNQRAGLVPAIYRYAIHDSSHPLMYRGGVSPISRERESEGSRHCEEHLR
jgi:hypothetical protein